MASSSPDPNYDPAYAATLLHRASSMQSEAAELLIALNLPAMLTELGEVELIGSAASGLMVWRDIDLGVRCQNLTPERAWTALSPLTSDPRLVSLHYRNETGSRSPSGLPADERLYLVCQYEAAPDAIWKIDLSLWTSPAPRPHLGHVEELRRRLSDETRLAILWIKDVWYQLPVYPHEVVGTDVYDAVLDHGVRTPDDFDAYLRARSLPSRKPRHSGADHPDTA